MARSFRIRRFMRGRYLPYLGDQWFTQDLGSTGGTMPGTPEVQAGTSPVAVVHCGWTSVYTVDWDHQLQETYLPAIGDAWSTQSLSATPLTSTTPTAVVHSAGATGSVATCGFTSVYTVDQSNSHLDETYLTLISVPWNEQDLSATAGTLPGTPPVAPGTAPVALVHTGYTSVYTVDEGNDHLQESYLPAIGSRWYTQDLSAQTKTPATGVTPAVVYHGGYTSVYTTDASNGQLWETYLTKIGAYWTAQNLTAEYHTPPVDAYTSPIAVYHDGFTSVYTVDTTNTTYGSTLGQLQETYLQAIGDSWVNQNLSNNYHTPLVNVLTSPTAVVHNGYVSVYTVNEESNVSRGDLQETFLPYMGSQWHTQDLSGAGGSLPGTPAMAVQQQITGSLRGSSGATVRSVKAFEVIRTDRDRLWHRNSDRGGRHPASDIACSFL